MSRYLYLCFISFSCFLACNGGDKVWKEIKEEAGELKEASEYSGKVSESDYRNGCKQIENKVKTAIGSEKKAERSKILDSLVNNTSSFDFYKLYKDSLGLACDAVSIRTKYGPYNINVFIDNSIRMDGYVSGNTEFKKDVPDLLRSIKNSNLSLYYINSDASNPDTSSEKIKEVSNLDYIKFAEKSSSDIRKSVLKDMISTAISAVGDTSISILISDFIIPIDTNSPDRYRPDFIINSIVKASNDIKGLFKEKKDLSLLVLRLESKFVGEYYDYKGKCYIDTFTIKFLNYLATPIKKKRDEARWQKNNFAKKISSLPEHDREAIAELEKEIIKWRNRENSYEKELNNLTKKQCSRILESFERPYFVWIFGTISQIEEVLSSEFFSDKKRKESEGYWLGKYIKNVDNLKFEIEDHDKVKHFNRKDSLFFKYEKINDSIHVSRIGDKNRKLEIPVRLTFGRSSKIAPEFFDEASDYKFGRGLDSLLLIREIKQLTADEKWTHRLVIMSNDAFGRQIEQKKRLDTLWRITKDDMVKLGSTVLINIEREFDSEGSIAKFSSEDDSDFLNSYKDKKTFGIDHLLRSVHDVYYRSPFDSFQIKIGVKK